MSKKVTLEEFVERVKKDKDVSFIVAFKKGSAEEAYYAPGLESQIYDELDNPVLIEKIKGPLLEKKYIELKAMTILNAHGSPGWKLVHLPSCFHIIVPS